MCPEMGPYSRIHRDYKYTSEYALLERKEKEAAEMQQQLESTSKREKDESKKIN